MKDQLDKDIEKILLSRKPEYIFLKNTFRDLNIFYTDVSCEEDCIHYVKDNIKICVYFKKIKTVYYNRILFNYLRSYVEEKDMSKFIKNAIIKYLKIDVENNYDYIF